LSYEDLVNSDKLYSAWQQRVLFVIPMVSGTLSILGSATVLYILSNDWRIKLRRVYHRLLLAFSVMDCFVSLNFALSSLVVPSGTPQTYGDVGTWATCRASGFFLQFGMSLGLYDTFICVYYLLIIRYKVREEIIAKRVEPVVHFLAVACPVVFGSYLVVHKGYNPGNIHTGHCFNNVYPANCLRVEGVECQQGESYKLFGLITVVLPFSVYFFVIFVSCTLTYLTVRDINQRQQRWDYSSSNLLAQNVRTASLRFTQANNHARQSLIQASLYVSSFFLVFSPYGVSVVVSIWYDGVKKNRAIFFPLAALVKLFMPSAGCWNVLIYIRPRYHQLRIRHPDVRSIQLLRKIIFNNVIVTEAPPAVHNQSNDDMEEQKCSSNSRSQRSVEDNDYTPELNFNETTTLLPSARVFPRQQELQGRNGNVTAKDMMTEEELQEDSSFSSTGDAATKPA